MGSRLLKAPLGVDAFSIFRLGVHIWVVLDQLLLPWIVLILFFFSDFPGISPDRVETLAENCTGLPGSLET